MNSILFALVADDSAQGITEYALLLGGVSLSMLLTLTALGVNMSDIYGKIAHNLDTMPLLEQ